MLDFVTDSLSKSSWPIAERGRLVAGLGPTNTGKTHHALERMLAHGSGMIGLPLRLLAREVYDRVVKIKGPDAVALITGEEKIAPRFARYFVSTVEAMPLDKKVEFLAVDEIQLCTDRERGHIFTHRLLHARGLSETMLLGSATAAQLICRLCPKVEIEARARLSNLTYVGAQKTSRLPPRSAIVAFSAEAVYGIAELIRRQRGGAAVVMGSLSPRTRNAQVALFQSGEVEFLVATDAIGMGLNMDVEHVAFAGLRKFDGRATRLLHPHEIGQIAGRAGRFRADGTFGVTGDAREFDDETVEAVEGHQFRRLEAAEWRNAALDFDSVDALIASLGAPSPRPGLRLSEEAQDETTLRQLADDPMILRRCRDRANVARLWDVCQLPDFRKSTQEEHTRLALTLFEHLTERDRRVPADWMQNLFVSLDRVDGDIDTLSARIARARTLAYIANRADWTVDAEGWRAKARGLEDRLSDVLHETLMRRFVDRRTSVLMRSLKQTAGPALDGIEADGGVVVEGHRVGTLSGVDFEAARGETALENRALRGAVERALTPEIARRLGDLAAADDRAFTLASDGIVVWRGHRVGEIAGGEPFSPKVRLFGAIGAPQQRERAQRRLEAYVAAEASRRLAPLRALEDAIGDGSLRGLARGLAYQLVENAGVLDRRKAAAPVFALSPRERRELRALGARFGAFSIYLPACLTPDALELGEVFAMLAAPGWRPSAGGLTGLPTPHPPVVALSRRGLRAVEHYAVRVVDLEAVDAFARATPDAFAPPEPWLANVGWPRASVAPILRSLGFHALREPAGPAMGLWRRRDKAAPRAMPAAHAPPIIAPPTVAVRKKRRRRTRRGALSADRPAG